MQITEKHQQEIEDIMTNIECPKNFACYQSGFEDVCRAKNIGLDDYVDCLQEAPFIQLCPFALSFGKSYLCKCLLRVYLVKHLHI